jgi:hypothetical protein
MICWFVMPIVEMPSIWWILSPGARKSAFGSSAFIASITAGYDKSVRSGIIVEFISDFIMED